MMTISEKFYLFMLSLCFFLGGCGSSSEGPGVNVVPEPPSLQLEIANADLTGIYHSLSVSYSDVTTGAREIYYRSISHNNGIFTTGAVSIFNPEEILLHDYNFLPSNDGTGTIQVQTSASTGSFKIQTSFVASMDGDFAVFSLGLPQVSTPVFNLQIRSLGTASPVTSELFKGIYGFVELGFDGRALIGEFDFKNNGSAVGRLFGTTDIGAVSTSGRELETSYTVDNNGSLHFMGRDWNTGHNSQIAFSGESTNNGTLKDRLSLLLKNSTADEWIGDSAYRVLQWTIVSPSSVDGTSLTTFSPKYNLTENVNWGNIVFQHNNATLSDLLGRIQYSEKPVLVPGTDILHYFPNNETNVKGRFFRFFGSSDGRVLIGLDYGNHLRGRVSLLLALRSS